jgi:signal transduction histidine kinase
MFRLPVTRSFAVTRISQVTARIFGIVIMLSGTETALNAARQWQYLDPFWARIALALLAFGSFCAVIGPWVLSSPRIPLLIHSLTIAVVTAFWWLEVPNPELLPSGYQPWPWWAIALGAISAGLSMPFFYGDLYLCGMPIFWFFLHQTEVGGSGPAFNAFQDALYAFFVSSCFTVILLFLRGEAARTDKANELAALAEVRRAEIDAIEQERNRVDALIHDKVLTALLVAANETSDSDFEEARLLATQAIDALTASQLGHEQYESSTTYGFFGTLIETYRHADSGFVISESGASDLMLPANVCSAFAEATAQAAINSLQHAGVGVERFIHLKGSSRGIKIVIVDHGRGFRPSRVPKSRLGLRHSIINRVESVGGEVFIDSHSGKGTTIVLEWVAP